jgi:multiple sugar transport system ATP-binding protein
MARVRLEGIGKEYENGFVAVHDATFEIGDGELVVLVGPSGCGKSTTLRMIAGLESITRGSLYIGDRLVNDVAPKDRDIAMVFQNYALYPHMTVYDNLAFGLRLRKLPKRDIDAQVRQAADILGIEPILDRRPGQLSGGQRQRVALGRAIVRRPQVFLFDEPLSNLDAKLRVHTRKEIARLHRQLGATMVYVTHDQVEAMTLGDRIVVMNAGVVQQIDRPLTLYEKPANRFVAGFIGSPAMNFVRGTIDGDDGFAFRAADGDITVPIDEPRRAGLMPYRGREVVLGVRPENVSVNGDGGAATMMLDVVEPMGNELFLYARSNANEIVARVPPQPLPPPGDSIGLSIDHRRVHFFDGESEETIAG